MSNFIDYLNNKTRTFNRYSRLNEDTEIAGNIDKCIQIVDKFNDQLKKVYDVAMQTTQTGLKKEFVTINKRLQDDLKEYRDNLSNIKQYESSPVQPKDLDELKEIVEYTIQRKGPNCDLNFIDVSNITDMSELFYGTKFDGDISKWDVSNVTNMCRMFQGCPFNGDISKWNVSSVENMAAMFFKSSFNRDISKWDVSNVENMNYMFYTSKFNRDISKWDVSNVTNMKGMFQQSEFNGDISKWDVSNVEFMGWMFANCPFNQDISKWNVRKVKGNKDMFENCPIKDEYKPHFR